MQQRALIDDTAKQNLLAYARGDNLEHLGALVGVERLQPTAAVCTMRLTLSATRAVATIIPRGTRFTAGDNVYFALDDDLTFLAGEMILDARASCTQTGTSGNGYLPGEINTIADPQPFLQDAVNVTKSEGGSDLEVDDAFRERIHQAPESFSVAGPHGAYRFYAMNASSAIIDVSVQSPEPGVVEIRPLLQGGQLPSTELLELVDAAVNDRRIRPLTDCVRVTAPQTVEYQIDFTYRIARSDATSAAAIQSAVAAAVQEYALWQRSELGRDIEPSELIYRVRQAGAKHINLRVPEFRVIEAKAIAVPTYISHAYSGLEDD